MGQKRTENTLSWPGCHQMSWEWISGPDCEALTAQNMHLIYLKWTRWGGHHNGVRSWQKSLLQSLETTDWRCSSVNIFLKVNLAMTRIRCIPNLYKVYW